MSRPLVIAHRGAHDHATPENTLAAFARAKRLNADAVELDVRRTRDDELVVFHDHTAGGARLDQLTHEQLKQIAQLDVPTLEEVLAWARENEVPLDVELKEDGYVHRAADLLGEETMIVTSFSDQVLRQLPGRNTGLLISLTARMAVTRARHCSADALVVQAKLVNDRLQAEAGEAGLRLLVWDFDPRAHAHLAQAPIKETGAATVVSPIPAGFITDHPAETIALLTGAESL